MCNINIDECATNLCHNGGTCIDGINSFTCVCPEGYHDATCFSQVNECLSNPCIHGHCEDKINGWGKLRLAPQVQIFCIQLPLFLLLHQNYLTSLRFGVWHTCAYSMRTQKCYIFSLPATNASVTQAGAAKTAISIIMSVSPTHVWMEVPAKTWPADMFALVGWDSLVSTCMRSMFCIKVWDWRVFNVCPAGPNCQTNINECASNPCLNHGTCIDDVAGYKCNCILPYTGIKILGKLLGIFHSTRCLDATMIIWLQGKMSGWLNNCPLRFIGKIYSGIEDTPPLPLCDTQICLKMELENIFMSSCVLFDKNKYGGMPWGKMSSALGHFWKILWTLSSKRLLLEPGWEQGAVHISCLHASCLTERQKLNNGRKLALASCKSPVLWKQIGNYFYRPQTLTEPG